MPELELREGIVINLTVGTEYYNREVRALNHTFSNAYLNIFQSSNKPKFFFAGQALLVYPTNMFIGNFFHRKSAKKIV